MFYVCLVPELSADVAGSDPQLSQFNNSYSETTTKNIKIQKKKINVLIKKVYALTYFPKHGINKM